MKIAVTGANGQVGSEVCLLLRDVPGIEVVPVARNPSGSAFLRSQGLACRHGRIADPAEALELIGDCDVVAHFALSNTGRPRADWEVNRAMTRNVTLCARPGARLISFSTIMVYAPNTWIGMMPDSYGLEKRANERLFLRLAPRRGCEAVVLRLGHVLGDLQETSLLIRRQIEEGVVMLPRGGAHGSNTVFTASIAETIRQVGAGAISGGTFDLITVPQWSWREVYSHYAAQSGVKLEIGAVVDPLRGLGQFSDVGGLVRRTLGLLGGQQFLRERLTYFLSWLPESVNARVHTQYLRARASREINALRAPPTFIAAAGWREIAVRPPPGLPSVEECLRRFSFPAGSILVRRPRALHDSDSNAH